MANTDVIIQVAGASHTRLRSNGGMNVASLPTHADNAAAISGGLVSGDIYKTATCELRIRV